MRRQLYLLAVLLCAWCIIQAVPAKPGFRTYTQSDGSQILLELVGDEFFHYFMTQDGLPVERDEHGDFHYIANNAVTTMMAHNPHDRTTAEQYFIKKQKENLVEPEPPQVMPRCTNTHPHKARAPLVTTVGSPRVPILLVQYADKQMANSKEQFEAHYKTDPKSVLQYFTDQSNGKYTPQFDIYGIYDLPEVRATYGHNQNQRKDAGVAWMVMPLMRPVMMLTGVSMTTMETARPMCALSFMPVWVRPGLGWEMPYGLASGCSVMPSISMMAGECRHAME